MTLALIPLLPFIAFGLLIVVGRRLGKLSAGVALLALLGSLLLSVSSFSELPGPPSALAGAGQTLNSELHFTWTWASLGEKPFTLGLLMDPLSAVMSLVVTIVGFLIMFYSIGYMGEDPRFSRFFAYLSLFFSAMLLLVLADHFILLYIGWEGVGLCSYLLISFWFERPAAANAGKKAFLTTRVGDLGLLAAILLMAAITGDLSLTNLSSKATVLGPWAGAIALLIFWGAAGKSAQFPLHVWLPDAMEGPTPVSALIHAATMVAAGVYLVARSFPLFTATPESLQVVAAVGGMTSFFAATIACTQTDLKRILAYSTISQLGLMMLGLGCGSAFAGMFHLVTHAWFKALLFLGAGSVIHALHHQEITRMGGLYKSMPVTASTFAIGAIAMAGIPPLSGFWSKEEILVAAQGHSTALLWFALAISWLTAFYISRAVILTFFGKPRESSHPHESPGVMTAPLVVLAIGAAGLGIIGGWLQNFLGAQTHGTHHATTTLPQTAGLIALSAVALAFYRYQLGKHLPSLLRNALRPLYDLAANKYYVDEIYERFLIEPVLRISRAAFGFDSETIDAAVNGTGVFGLRLSALKGWIDRVIVDGAVNGIGATAARTGGVLRLIQTGLVQNYLLIAVASTVTIFLILQWRS